MTPIVVSPDQAQAIGMAVYAVARDGGMSREQADRFMIQVLMRLGIQEAPAVAQHTVEKATNV
jgi:hypothetical protein